MQKDIEHLKKILSRYDEEAMGAEATDILYKALEQLTKIVIRQENVLDALDRRTQPQ